VSELTIAVADLEGTMALGLRLGSLLFPGAVIGLVGPLGAGKTHFVRAVALGLEIRDSRAVSSPTFVLIQEYPARLPIYHFDAYRLKSAAEFADLGIDEYFAAGGVCLIEWSDRVAECLPHERLDIEIEVTGPDARVFRLRPLGEACERLAAALYAILGNG
jgi:tRNA threonylcarbamoyladenosine biosynthesis protein TsaE